MKIYPWLAVIKAFAGAHFTRDTSSVDCFPQSTGNGSIVPKPQTNLTNCINMTTEQQYPRLCTDDNNSITSTPIDPFNLHDGSTLFTIRAANGTNTTDCNPGMLLLSIDGAELLVCADGGNGTNKVAPNLLSAKNESGIVVSVYSTGDNAKKVCLENKIADADVAGTTCYSGSAMNLR